MRKHIAALLACVALAGSFARADTVVDLGDRNSTMKINVDSTSHPLGISEWIVDGTSYIFEQWFYYRVGPNDAERPISSLTRANLVVSNTNGDSREPEAAGIRGAVQSPPPN
jgi:hypothetical protein